MATPLKFEYEGKEYTLEFNREAVRMAERSGFDVENFDAKVLSNSEDLFYFSFRMHHPEVTMEDAMDILYKGFGGLKAEEVRQLIELFSEPYISLMNVEGNEKNVRRVTIR